MIRNSSHCSAPVGGNRRKAGMAWRTPANRSLRSARGNVRLGIVDDCVRSWWLRTGDREDSRWRVTGSNAFCSYIKEKSRFQCVCLQPSRPCPRPLFFTMPSLRRFPSSAAGRRSPYSSASVRARRCRRSAPSETSGRRVLADITWWTVAEGQCDSNLVDISDAPFTENNINDASPIDASVQQPSTLVLPWVSTVSEDVPEVLLAECP